MGILITSNNIRDFVGRQVFDSAYQNDYGIGVIVSTFQISGELGCRVHYTLDRLVAKSTGPMSGMIVMGPQSGTINTGHSYVMLGQMADRYTATPEGIASIEGQWIGMNWDPQYQSGATGFFEQEYKLTRQTYFDGTVDYYPDLYSSGQPTVSRLKIV